MNNIFKRMLSLLLVLVMCISFVPASAVAENSLEPAETEEIIETTEILPEEQTEETPPVKEDESAEHEPESESSETLASEDPLAEKEPAQLNASNASIVASGTCGDNLTWTLDSDGLLTISGTGNMTGYKSSNPPWYSNVSSIKSVKINSGVTSVGVFAFYKCDSLTSVEIGDSVTSIGDGAFSSCDSLISIEIPDSVISIGVCAFSSCDNLTNVEIGDGVTSIGDSAFCLCDNLTNVEIGDGVTSIGDGAFDYCISLTSIEIPDSVTSIGGCAFSYCDSLTNIEIPDSVTSIGDGAFQYCISLTSIEIPDSVTSVGDFTFCDCNSLTSIKIPNSVTSIGDSAFSSCDNLTNIEIPDSVTSIGNYAFAYCSSLTDVYYAGTEVQWNGISIGEYNECLTNATIHYSEKLYTLGYRENVGYIIEKANGKLIGKIIVPEEIDGNMICGIGEEAFKDCTGITRIIIPNTVTFMGDNAFCGCKGLLNAEFQGVAPEFGDSVFDDCGKDFAIWFTGSTDGWPSGTKSGTHVQLNEYEGYPCYPKQGGVTIKHSYSGEEQKDYEKTITDVDYSDSYFTTSNSSINYSLAEVSLLMTMASSANQANADYKSSVLTSDRFIRQALETAGFENDYYEYRYGDSKSTYDEEAYAVAWKTLEDGTPLVALVVRSNGYGGGWYSNANVVSTYGNNKHSEGFYHSAQIIVNGGGRDSVGNTSLKQYCKDNEIDTTKAKFWVCGYSRGGAVANCVGGIMNSDSAFSNSNLYVYTFATPRTVKKSALTSCRGVYNIVAEMDIVPQVPLQAWKYTRFGKTYCLPCKSVTSEYSSRLSSMESKFYALTSDMGCAQSFRSIQGQELCVDQLTEILYKAMKSDNDYYGDIQDYVKNLCYDTFVKAENEESIADLSTIIDELLSKNSFSKIKTVIRDRDNYNFFEFIHALCKAAKDDKPHTPLASVFEELVEFLVKFDAKLIGSEISSWFTGENNFKNTKEYKFVDYLCDLIAYSQAGMTFTSEALMQHWPEEYLAWLRSGNQENTLYDTAKSGYKRYCDACPVDVTVYDSNDVIVAQVVNEEVIVDTLTVFVEPTGEKEIIIPNDDEYRVVTTSRESDATMSCTITSCGIDGDVQDRTVYYDLPLTEGQTFTSDVVPGEDISLSSGGEIILPDEILTEDDYLGTEIAINVVGNGKVYGDGAYTKGDIATICATAEEDSVFLGWYEDGKLISSDETYCFSVKEDITLTAIFASKDVQITIDRKYMAIQIGTDAVQLEVTINPEQWGYFLAWSAENPEGQNIISVSENGAVTPMAKGTAYAVATIEYKDYTFTARCRVDVTEDEVNAEMAGVQLGTDKLTSELYSRNYSSFDVILLLEQNLTANLGESASSYNRPENNGAAIESARFTDAAVNEMFELVVADDRQIEIVPTENAINNPKEVKSSYSSTVTVTVGGEEFTTEGSLKLTVKKTLPKLKAAAVTFNSFYGEQTAELTITGGTPVSISADTSKKTPLPSWLGIDGLSLCTNETVPDKNCSGTAYLLVETEEWEVPIQVSVSVKNVYKAAVLKTAKSSVTLNPALNDSADIAINATPADYIIEDPVIAVYKGKNPAADGELTAEYADGKLHIETTDSTLYNSTYKVSLKAGNCKEVYVTVKTFKSNIKPSVTLKATGTIDLSYSGSEAKLTPTFKNYNSGITEIASVTVNVLNGKTAISNGEVSDYFECRYDGTDIYLSAKDSVEYSTKYTYAISAEYKINETNTVTGSLNLKLKQTAAGVKLEKSSITLNPIIAEYAYVSVTPTLKDCTLEDVTLRVTDKKGNETSDIGVKYENGKLYISTSEDTEYGTSYTISVTPNAAVAKTSKLTVKTPAQKSAAVKPVLKLKGTIDPIRDDSTVNVTVSYKNYLGGQDTENTIKVYAGTDEDTDMFECTETETGYTIKKAHGASIDSSKKYKVCLEMTFANDVTVKSDLTALTVKMGTAKYRTDKTALTLYGKDKYSQAEFTIDSVDITLNKAETVEIKDAKNSALFELHELGNGKYAIGFKNNMVAKTVSSGKKTVSVPLTVTAKGNTSAKPNATVTIKVTIVN